MLNSASEVDDLTGPSGLVQGGRVGGVELVVEALGAGKQVLVAVEDGDDGAVPGSGGDLGGAGPFDPLLRVPVEGVGVGAGVIDRPDGDPILALKEVGRSLPCGPRQGGPRLGPAWLLPPVLPSLSVREWGYEMVRVRRSVALLVAAVVLVGACSDDADDTDEAATTTTAAEATTTTTSDASLSPPEPGEPNTASIVFEDGETGTVPVTCEFDTEDGFDLIARSEEQPDSYFELLISDQAPLSSWVNVDGVWLVGPNEEMDVNYDPPGPVTATGVYVEAQLNEQGEVDAPEGQPLTTGEERAAALTVVCAE